jgi:hypothetical protein
MMSNDKTRLARAPLSFDIREKRRGLFLYFAKIIIRSCCSRAAKQRFDGGLIFREEIMLSLLKKYLAVDVWFILQDSCFSPVVRQSEDAFRLFRIVLNEPNIYLGRASFLWHVLMMSICVRLLLHRFVKLWYKGKESRDGFV